MKQILEKHVHLEILRPLEISKRWFWAHQGSSELQLLLFTKWLLPNGGGWRETTTLLGGSHCCIYSTFSSGWGKWQVNHEQLTKNLAVIWGILRWTFRPICHCRPTVQFLLWKLCCLRCILLRLKWLLHSANASGIRLYSFQRPWPTGWEWLMHRHQTSDGEK